MAIRITFWGVRGSLPSPIQPQALIERVRDLFQAFFAAGHRNADDIDRFLDSLTPQRIGRYGGNTLCLEGQTERQQLSSTRAGTSVDV